MGEALRRGMTCKIGAGYRERIVKDARFAFVPLAEFLRKE